MKTRFIFTMAFLAVSVVAWYGCSKDENTEQSSDHQLQNFHRIESSELNGYLEDFYQTTISFGNSVTEEITSEGYSIKEVIVGGGTRARGYVAFDTNDEPVYFIDVNRIGYKMTFVDLVTEETELEFGINNMPFYSENEFDFIEIIETINKDGENAYGSYEGVIEPDWTFWGPKEHCYPSHWDYNFTPRQCWKTCKVWKVRFFLRFGSHDEPRPGENCN